MSFQEKDFQRLFSRYAKENLLPTGLYELKITRKNKFYRKLVASHQIDSLRKAKHKILAHKISDASPGYKPADMFILNKEKGYLVIMFYKPRKTKKAYIVDIDILLSWNNKLKSFTEYDIESIAERVVFI